MRFKNIQGEKHGLLTVLYFIKTEENFGIDRDNYVSAIDEYKPKKSVGEIENEDG